MKKVMSRMAIMMMVVLVMTACGNTTGTNTESVNKTNSQNKDVSKEKGKKDSSASGKAVSGSDTSASDKQLTGKHHVEIKVKDYGTIKVELDADTAPITVTNFVKLAKDGFYNDLTFHRIISGFMIQGGDPNGDGTGGSDETIKGEFSTNGIENNISHKRGVISMARAMDNDSASSQFFIVHKDSDFLDGQYAAFGTVTDGMEVVDKICEDVEVEDDNGTVLEENQPIIESIVVKD